MQLTHGLTQTQSVIQRRTKKLKTHLHSTKWGWEMQSNLCRTHPQDVTGNNDHRKFQKILSSNIKTNFRSF